jgi:hypothetical protein
MLTIEPYVFFVRSPARGNSTVVRGLSVLVTVE